MQFLIAGALIVLGFVFLAFTLVKCGDAAFGDASKLWYLVGFVSFSLLFAGMFKLASDENKVGPCLKKETGYAYNAATKTTMPYTKCVERGEWVK
jgi:hypothetical protein